MMRSSQSKRSPLQTGSTLRRRFVARKFSVPVPYLNAGDPGSIASPRTKRDGAGSAQDLLEEKPRPLVLRMVEKALRLVDLENLAVGHEDHAVGDLTGKAHLVRDHQHGDAVGATRAVHKHIAGR
jgi:hypothetical protein